ncbi:DUF6501 family protein [Saliterribacillus persicus]|uniref:Uncharacterized protein n=1 Tax=Saliterribacillus persicus TaxID=930114 RepID=A0A368XAU4_9BACI|nr:DUF6501 family protein [Saliterribacillus persicus]RCW64975.1 hypothetical protein DFR57_112154 [Saliterribacillus persicus]
MIHKQWETFDTIKKIKCVHTDAKKFMVKNVLSAGEIYEVKNETEEFYFILDNTNRIGGFRKNYFEEI